MSFSEGKEVVAVIAGGRGSDVKSRGSGDGGTATSVVASAFADDDNNISAMMMMIAASRSALIMIGQAPMVHCNQSNNNTLSLSVRTRSRAAVCFPAPCLGMTDSDIFLSGYV